MDKKLLVEYYPLQYDQSQILAEAADPHKPITVKGILQRANAKNQNGRVYPREILMRESQKYESEFIKQRRALGELDHPECHRPSAEILTDRGWKLLSDVSVSESVATLNTTTNAVEYQPVQRVINQPYTGKMISFVGKNINALVTPNHRFILHDRNKNVIEKTAQEILELSKTTDFTHLSIPKVASHWSGTHYDEFVIPGVVMTHGVLENRDRQSQPLHLNADAFFEFLGIYLAEGHVTNRDAGNGFTVYISQNCGPKAEHIRSVLNSMSLDLVWGERTRSNNKRIVFYVSDARLHTYLSALGSKYTKYIPNDIKNASKPLLQSLFNGYLVGDGTVVEHKGYLRTSIFSASKQLMEDFQEIVLKLGMAGRIKTQVSTRAYQFAGHEILPEKKKPLYRLWIERSKNIHLDFRFLTVDEVDYDGTVHCVTVQNGTFFCRDGGKSFWSGNSTVVNLRNVSHNITEMHWEGDDLMGTIEILSTPSGNIVKELMKNGIRLGVSSRGVGSVNNLGEGTVEVDEDFNLICFDIVSNPSTHGAFLNEGVEANVETHSNLNTLIYDFFAELK